MNKEINVLNSIKYSIGNKFNDKITFYKAKIKVKNICQAYTSNEIQNPNQM